MYSIVNKYLLTWIMMFCITGISLNALAQSPNPTLMGAITTVEYPPTAYPQDINIGTQAVVIKLNGHSGNGNPIQYTIVSQPTNGTLANFDSTTGEVTYTPANSIKSDSFTFKVNDGYHESSPATITLDYSQTNTNAGGGGGGGGAVDPFVLLLLAIGVLVNRYRYISR